MLSLLLNLPAQQRLLRNLIPHSSIRSLTRLLSKRSLSRSKRRSRRRQQWPPRQSRSKRHSPLKPLKLLHLFNNLDQSLKLSLLSVRVNLSHLKSLLVLSSSRQSLKQYSKSLQSLYPRSLTVHFCNKVLPKLVKQRNQPHFLYKSLMLVVGFGNTPLQVKKKLNQFQSHCHKSFSRHQW